jgi:hypothetical protein
MDKSNFAGNINKKIKKDSNALYLIINKNQSFTSYNTDKNLINIALNNKELNFIPNSLFYLPWSSINSGSATAIKNSFAMRLAKTILQNIDKKSANIKLNKILSSNFYHICLNNLSNTVDDKELLELYLKQLYLILKNTSVFDNPEKFVPVNNTLFNYNYIQLYFNMLNSFWHKMNWDLLFPSMPETAMDLKINKKILIDLLLRKKDKFRIDKIANEFFKSSGLGRANDLLLISFLDFGIFTWLDHFGIINYLNGSDIDPVFIKVTEHGRMMLKYLALE